MAGLFARIGRFEAPVDYGVIYPWLQRVRTVAAGTIFLASIAAIWMGITDAWFPATLAAVIIGHSVVRARMHHGAMEALVIDAIALPLGIGISHHAHAPLVAAAAYLIAGSIVFAGLRTLLISLGAFATSLAVRPFIPITSPTPATPAGEALVWVSTGVFLGGVALALMTAATEVFKAKRLQSQALESERRAAEMKNEFVSMITHELRTPLTNISGFAETLQQTWQDLPAEDVNEFLRVIVSESEHLQNLVEDVLTIPRLEAARLLIETTDFSLKATAFKVVNLVFPEGGDRSASVSIDGTVMVHADPHRVEQVLRNLVGNARKYGGDTVTVEAVPRGDTWEIIVADNGAGLPADAEARIFEAFEQVTSGDARTESGFGLGLTVARHLVEAMEGRIWYEPGFPTGSRFCFTLPVAEGNAEKDQREVA